MEVAPLGQGANGQVTPPTAETSIDPEILVQHLSALLEITLGASTAELESKGSILSDSKRSETVQRCLRFASEAQVALYVQKDLIATNASHALPNGHHEPGNVLAPLDCSFLLMPHTRTYRPASIFHIVRDLLFLDHSSLSRTHKTSFTHKHSSASCDSDSGHQPPRRRFVE